MYDRWGPNLMILPYPNWNTPLPDSGAIFDASARYRYRLWRSWNPARPGITFVMLNPSVADAKCNDPTIRRCLGFAQSWGFGSLEVVNLFALCTSDPVLLKESPDPIGPENDFYLQSAVEKGPVLAAWGCHGGMGQRDEMVLGMLPVRRLWCLGITKRGHPRHPLYVAAATRPVPLRY